MRKRETRPLCVTIHKTNSKRIKDWNVRPKAIKYIEEHIDSKLFDIGFSEVFVDLTLAGKFKPWDYIKVKASAQ